MGFGKMAFDPPEGLRKQSAYKATPGSEEEAREQIQGRLDEIKDYINNRLVDTSFVYELWGKSRNISKKTECQNFTNALANRGVILLTSIKLHEELRILIERDIIGSGYQGKENLRKNPQLMVQVKNTIDAIELALKGNANYLGEPVGIINSELLSAVDNIRDTYGIRYGDAVHYAICKKENITNIATLDGDYTKIADPDLAVYLDSSKFSNSTTCFNTVKSI